MIHICSQPDIQYFHWQVEVLLTNFEKIGIEEAHVIFLYEDKISKESKLLSKEFKKYKFFWYKDQREDKSYSATAKPYGVYKHFKNDNVKGSDILFYHDSDIIFTEKLDYNKFINDEKIYLSDTVSYIGYGYIKNKGVEQMLKICKHMDIDVSILEMNQNSSGGAQYILKNMNENMWLNIYNDSNKLYNYFLELEKEWSPRHIGDIFIQKWCAEMWATLWNLWKEGFETCIDKELDFVFCTSPIEEVHNKKIIHNAGVTTKESKTLFYKSNFILKSPFNSDLSFVDKKKCSFLYKRAIDDVKIRRNNKDK